MGLFVLPKFPNKRSIYAYSLDYTCFLRLDISDKRTKIYQITPINEAYELPYVISYDVVVDGLGKLRAKVKAKKNNYMVKPVSELYKSLNEAISLIGIVNVENYTISQIIPKIRRFVTGIRKFYLITNSYVKCINEYSSDLNVRPKAYIIQSPLCVFLC